MKYSAGSKIERSANIYIYIYIYIYMYMKYNSYLFLNSDKEI